MPNDLVDYFRTLTGERSVRAMAARAGLEQTTLNRQLNGTTTLTVETVVALCRAYNLDFATVFVAVGFITEDEAARFSRQFHLSAIPDAELTREIVRRLDAGEAGAALTEPISPEIVEDVLHEHDPENVTYLGKLNQNDLPTRKAADTRPRKADEDPAD